MTASGGIPTLVIKPPYDPTEGLRSTSSGRKKKSLLIMLEKVKGASR